MVRIMARYRSGIRWLAAGVVGFAVPKCFLCLIGYTALATSLGWAGPELCGGTTPGHFPVLAGSMAAAVAIVAVHGRRVRRSRR